MGGEADIPIYRDGRHYDRMFGVGQEPHFWVELAREIGGPLLELACGTGAKAIPMARTGLAVTGLDSSEAMLTEARRKAREANVMVEWILGDMRSFALDRSFNLILLLANSICHLLTYQDLEACLACVRRHLAPDGRFVVRVFVPDVSLLTGDADERRSFASYADPDSGEPIVVTHTSRYDPATQIKHNRLYARVGEGAEQEVGEMPMRMYFPQELDALFVYNGFAIEQKYGDPDRSPFDADSSVQIYILALGR